MTNSAKIADKMIAESRGILSRASRIPGKPSSDAPKPAVCPSGYVVPHVMSIAAHKAAFGAANQSKE